MYVEATGGTDGAADAIHELEGRFQSLRGRKFYGTYLDGEYRACVAIKEGDDPAELDLKTWVIPGGEFACRKLDDYEEKIPEIGQTFQAMIAENPWDSTRPSIEFYRSHDELILYLPTLK